MDRRDMVPDGLDERDILRRVPGAPSPIPPELEDAMVRAEIEAAQLRSEMETALIQAADQRLREGEDLRQQMEIAVATQIGAVDSELRETGTQVYGKINSMMDTILRDLIHTEEEMRANGVDIPRGTEALEIALNDETGMGVVNQIVPPSAPDVPPVPQPVFDLPAPEPVPVPPPMSPPPPPELPPPPPLAPPIPPQPVPVPPPMISSIPSMDPGYEQPGCDVIPPGALKAKWKLPFGAQPNEALPAPPGYTLGRAGDGCWFYFPASPSIILTTSPPVPPPVPVPPPPPPPFVPDWVEVTSAFSIGPLLGNICDVDASLQRSYSTGPFVSAAVTRAESVRTIGGIWRGALALLNGFVTGVLSFDTNLTRAVTAAAYTQTGDLLAGVSQFLFMSDAIPGYTTEERLRIQNMAILIGSWNKACESIGFDGAHLIAPVTYALNSQHPNFLLSQAEADRAYFNGSIALETWRCITMAQGNRLQYREASMEASFAFPNIGETVALKNRDALTDREYERAMRRNGVQSKDVRAQYERLAEAVPGPADLVRFMQRDAADDEIARRYNNDKDFETKLYGTGGREDPGPMAAWMKAQGVTEEMMRFDWRSHWQIPSNTALYEMLHRLRPDRQEVKDWNARHPDWKPGDLVPANDPRPQVVTFDDAREAIEVNDMSPGWVQRLIDISYHPITRTDAIDAYHNGTFDEARFLSVMLDNGYAPESAQLLLDIQKNKRAMRLANNSGVWTVRAIMREYEAGTIDGMTADDLLTPLVIDPQQRARLIDGADRHARALVIREAVKRWKRAFIVGEIDGRAAFQNLEDAGVATARINDTIRMWTQQRDGRYKEPTARQIIGWSQVGIISEEDAFTRFKRLGYSDVDARRMVQQGVRARSIEVAKDARARAASAEKVIKDKKQAAREERQTLVNRLETLKKAKAAATLEEARIVFELAERDGVDLPEPPFPKLEEGRDGASPADTGE